MEYIVFLGYIPPEDAIFPEIVCGLVDVAETINFEELDVPPNEDIYTYTSGGGYGRRRRGRYNFASRDRKDTRSHTEEVPRKRSKLCHGRKRPNTI
jgi:hypothetical protein